MKAFKAVIFDMDGVIVNSEPFHERAFLDVFDALGYRATHGVDFTAFIGRSDKDVWLDFVARHTPPQPMEELARYKQERLFELVRKERPIFPGVQTLVRELRGRFQLGLASGSVHDFIGLVLDLAELRSCFEVVVSSQDVLHGKPAPDIFLRAAGLLGVAPGDCCVVEDSRAGIEAARAAGMSVVAITNTFGAGDLARATHVVHSYAEAGRFLCGGT
jgi:HAD superfamily hydrolase (TIGR01509 family)